ncbi:MAG: NAD/NADP octopine/nopaline dehydrogenase family protein [Alloprevotella sp.]|nr:NAD/NADP octopine/nopaline dehydrogenase family protein [Prevotella sp.]MBR1712784.1 NAD/NADP octopine/nopaline dehydrogenase family protein [Alloprevotella sp.]
MTITICGGGNIGHACAGFIAAHHTGNVRLLTTRPKEWIQNLVVADKNYESIGKISLITDQAEKAVKGSDLVLLCLPGFAIRPTLKALRPHLEPNTAVGSAVCNTGFFFAAQDILHPTTPLFGFQRVPFIARTETYGQRVAILGHKTRLYVATERFDNPEGLRSVLENLLQTPVSLLESHFEASLSNSNPLLHPARLYDLWHDWRPGITYKGVPAFYAEWTEEAAELYINMDAELQKLLRHLGIREGAVPDVLTYYESHDAPSLARKLRSITAFQSISSPMLKAGGGFIPDVSSRYFTEDFPFGLRPIAETAARYGIATPEIGRVLLWGERMMTEATDKQNHKHLI